MIGFLLIMIVMHFLTDGGRVGDVLHLGLVGCDAELANALPLGQRRKLHVDVTSRELGLHVHMGHGQQILFDLLHQLKTHFLVRHLASTELELNTDFVTVEQEIFGMSDLDEVVMGVDAHAELHLLQLAGLVLLEGFLLVLLLNVFVFAVIDDLAHRRVDVGRDLDEVEALFFGQADGLRSGQHTELFATGSVDHAHSWGADAFVHSSLIDVSSTTIEGWTAIVVVAVAATSAVVI